MRKDLKMKYWYKCANIFMMAFLICSTALGQQTVKISGTVISSTDNKPLNGVTISVKGSTIGTSTSSTGTYSINAAKGATLVFSFTGATAKEFVVGDAAIINATLDLKTGDLNEVVVVGYGTQKKINVTGSVATIKAKEIEGIPVSNVSNALVGRLPGFTAVNRGGEPGSDVPEISIRGFDNMLVIVDGVQADFNNLDPGEIESISILKDAAASVYGARAGNGVLLVTSKRGKDGKPTITFTANQGWQTPTRIAERVDAAGYATMQNAAQVATGFPKIYSDEAIQKYRDGTDPAYPNTDWYKATFRKWAPLGNYNLNSTGGNDNVRYFFSLGYLNQGGLLPSGDYNFNRYNIRLNVDAKISKNLSASLDISGRNEQRSGPGATMDDILQDIEFSLPTYAASFPDPNYIAYAGHQGTQPIGRSNSKFSGYTKGNNKFASIISTFTYKAPFLDGLTAKAMFNANLNYGANKNFYKAWNIYNYDAPSNTYSLVGPAQNANDQLNEAMSRGTDLTTQLSINYTKKIGLNDIGFLALGEFISNTSNYMFAHREGFLSTDIDQLFAGSQANKDNDGGAYNDGRIGYVSRLNYAYDGKYLAEASVRYDASARYIASRRWAYFPGISLGWRLSQENFLKNSSVVDNLKLRASYGQAGNDYVGQFNYLTGFNFGGNYVFGDNPTINTGIVSKGLANADLTWEKTATTNLGLEGSFWKGLLSFELDVFYRKVTGVAGTRNLSLPSTVGASLPQENINSYSNRGFEILLKHERSISKDFKYSLSANATFSRSKWIHFDEPVYPDQESRNRLQQSGKYRGQIFGYTADGLFQSQEEINKWPVDQDGSGNSTLQPGDIKYLDFNGDGKLNEKDNHVLGQGFSPNLFFGFNLGLQYKSFSFSALLQGAANYNAYFDAEVQNVFFNGTVPFKFMEDYWTPENKDAKYPRMYPGGAVNNQYFSTYWLQKADYLRVKTIQAGYTLPKSILAKAGISSVKVYVSAYNLFTFDNIFPFDPETGPGRGWFYPQQKSYNIGATVTF